MSINKKANDLFVQHLADRISEFKDDHAWTSEKIKHHECSMQTRWQDAAINYCESPIEQIMLAELMFTGFGYGSGMPEVWPQDFPFGRPDSDVVICCQFEIECYRTDFAILANVDNSADIKVVVECDGHAYHEKTKEQAARDKKRDRVLQNAGWQVVRFTGSEIFNDVSACADEIDSFIANLIEDDWVRTGKKNETRRYRLRQRETETRGGI